MNSWPFHRGPRRRVRIFLISFEALAGLLQLDGTFVLKMRGFPEGATLAFIEADNERGELKLYVEHESFAEVNEGCMAPTWPAIEATQFELPSAVIADVERVHG